ncbi:ribosomal protein 22 60S large ribosomal subunit [Blastocystis sp. ATCC 50177/Nand II]|uniref:Large ribosomal subunit protein eL22 n=1 Tax=Blastocystis sp. subtype 1 (strain ATCC 50177 / NandII) TaxID=478820 RepID=A0A196S895_BLAHN|nr:ribosomal protein 22 60S large ribosomal subunit [Blastocystis sp. ATCC 50177/Nand II]
MATTTKKIEFTIDCSVPVNDKIMEVESFEKFLKEHIKVENKTNNLGDLIGVSSSNDRISVAVSCAMAKRYLKYLTKKYLKKQQLRDYLRVVASGKTGYKLVYFNVSKEE